jgi:hypothetical protein
LKASKKDFAAGLAQCRCGFCTSVQSVGQLHACRCGFWGGILWEVSMEMAHHNEIIIWPMYRCKYPPFPFIPTCGFQFSKPL